MKIFTSLDELPQLDNIILTQGTFDGVHKGHQKVLKSVVDHAKLNNSKSMLLTFYPHPRLVINPNENSLRMLTTIEEKQALLENMGLDFMLVLPFTSEVSKYSPEQFVKEILVDRLHVKTIIVGYDHHFGHHRIGNFQTLIDLGVKYGFDVFEISANEIDHIAVSSTRIRKALLNGALEEANELLGRPYSFEGKVVHGQKIGRTLGYPTVNIEINDPFKLIPDAGIYASIAEIEGQRYKCAMNIGYRPTFGDFGMTIEGYVLEFSRDVYDLNIKFEIISRIRKEQKFKNVEELKEQIAKDVKETETLLQGI